MKRRDLIVGAGLAGTAAALGVAAVGAAPPAADAAAKTGRAARSDWTPVRQPDPARPITRLAFGSCAKEDKPQPIWDAIAALEPDLFVFLGDNVYGDTRDPAVLRAKYGRLGAQPGFRRFCERVPVLATWDDHDYGEDDAGAEYPMKEISREIFCDFWNEPADSARRSRDGIYERFLLGPEGRRLQLILPDLRFNRTPIRRLDLGGRDYRDWAGALEKAGREVPGPYEREPDGAATMLGTAQWRWLEQTLREPAEVRILGSSLQVVADFPGWEAWINYAQDHQRLLQAIRDARAGGLVCISGDTHYGELSLLDTNVPYPLWDLTSSGLTEVWHVTPPNARRIGEILREPNFGWIEIDWRPPSPRLALQVRDARGAVRIEQRIDSAALRV